jgi:hypothetical protein
MSPYLHPREEFESYLHDDPPRDGLARWRWWLAMAMVAACWGLIVSGVVWLT